MDESKMSAEFAKHAQTPIGSGIGGVVVELLYLALARSFGEPTFIGGVFFILVGAVLGHGVEYLYQRHVAGPKKLAEAALEENQRITARPDFVVAVVGRPLVGLHQNQVAIALTVRVTPERGYGSVGGLSAWVRNERGERKNAEDWHGWERLVFSGGEVDSAALPGSLVHLESGRTTEFAWVGTVPRSFWDNARSLDVTAQCVDHRDRPYMSKPVPVATEDAYAARVTVEAP